MVPQKTTKLVVLNAGSTLGKLTGKVIYIYRYLIYKCIPVKGRRFSLDYENLVNKAIAISRVLVRENVKTGENL